MLEDPAAWDESVLAQVDQVAATQKKLERRVVEHLLKVRKQLTPQQRKRLLEMVARGVRGKGMAWRRRQGMPRQRGPGTRPGPGGDRRGPMEQMHRRGRERGGPRMPGRLGPRPASRPGRAGQP